MFSAVASLVAATAAGVQATPLNLVQDYPDITVVSNTVGYNAGTQQFTATGRPVTYSTPAVYNITDTTITSYSLSAIIDNSGSASSGTLSIEGKIGAPINAASGTLLTGTLAAFGNGNSANGDPFEFIFTVTGGDLASAMGPQVGVILSAKSTNYIDWSYDFTGGSGATNDTFRVPEPATLAFLLAGMAAFLHKRR